MVILQWPASPSIISDGWGWRVHPITGVRTFHWGVDLSLGCGNRNRAAADGVVVWAAPNGGEGNSVHVDHGDGFLTKYFHGSQILVSVGQTVHRGEAVSITGTTGASTGCHLHFEVWVNGVNQNPREILTGDDVVTPYEGGASAPAGSGSTPLPRSDDDEVFSAEAQAWLTATVRDNARAAVRDVAVNLTDDQELALTNSIDSAKGALLTAVRRERGRLYFDSGVDGKTIQESSTRAIIGKVETGFIYPLNPDPNSRQGQVTSLRNTPYLAIAPGEEEKWVGLPTAQFDNLIEMINSNRRAAALEVVRQLQLTIDELTAELKVAPLVAATVRAGTFPARGLAGYEPELDAPAGDHELQPA